jgi:DNA-binding transcriptional MerR regulator
MNAIQPQVNKDARYSISETCNFLGIHRHTLRAWTEMGKIKSITRKSNGRTAYKGIDILSCWLSVM